MFQVGVLNKTSNPEVIYVLDVDDDNDIHRILRINPSESLKPTVVGQVPSDQTDLWSLFVTEAGTIYVLDQGERKVSGC